MELLIKAYEYLINNHVRFLEELQVHLTLSFSALFLV